MNAPRQSVERLLETAASETIADAGFTARVLVALPERAAGTRWWKPALILGSTALGCALAAFFAPGSASLTEGFLDLAAARFLTPSAVAALASAVALAVGTAILAAED